MKKTIQELEILNNLLKEEINTLQEKNLELKLNNILLNRELNNNGAQ